MGTGAILFILIVISVVLFCIWQNNDMVVSNHGFAHEKIPSSFDGYTIVHVSDLHNKRFGQNQHKLISVIEAEEPDMIVITGDIIDSRRTGLEQALIFVEQAARTAPVYYVTGNHEHRLSPPDFNRLMGKMAESGVHILDNDTVKLVSDENEHIYLLGLNDLSLFEEALKDLTNGLEESSFKALLAHEPQYLEAYEAGGADLVFAGHAHGGQIRLPLIGGFIAPGQGIFPDYTAGLYRKDEVTMVVSRGLGNSLFPFRVFNRPEIVTVHLQSKQ